MAAGAAAGAATAVKWSGLYAIAALGIYLVVTDALARRRAGVRIWPADAAFRQGAATFVLFVPIAVVVYLASWISWLTTDGGYARHAAVDAPVTGFWSWVPPALQSLWLYHRGDLRLPRRAHLRARLCEPRVAVAAPAAADLDVLPVDTAGSGGLRGRQRLRREHLQHAQPADLVRRRRGGDLPGVPVRPHPRLALRTVLTGVAATYLPWLLYPERTMFQFYTIAILPVPAARSHLRAPRHRGGVAHRPYRRTSGQRIVLVFLVVAVVLSAFWYPILTGTPVPYYFWQAHNWMQGWI